ncbi:MAG: (2Fe-2S) ferredoxin domain-containing protein [Peptococcaceae bacterium]|nr:(2Fe-2S) ferredoxin domain-containing protein [Peptococcaceae bacterium]
MVITVCVGSSCYIKGAHAVAECFQALISLHKLDARVELKGTFCLDRCKDGVAVTVNGQSLARVTPETAKEAFEKHILTEGGVK